MAKSTGIVLTAGGISFVNEWVNTKQVNFRIPMATFAVALLFDGIERIDERAAVGLATIMLITVLFTPFNGKTPAETVSSLLAEGSKGYKAPPSQAAPFQGSATAH